MASRGGAWWAGRMPHRVDGISRSHSVAVAVSQVIAEQGIPALTLRTVGAVSRVSPSGLVDQFGKRDRMLEVSAIILGRARIDGISRRRREGIRAFLPGSEDEIVDTRVWLGLCELGRGHQGVGFKVAAVRQEERHLLRWIVGQAQADETRCAAPAPGAADDANDDAGGDEGLDLLMAVLDGLNTRLCDPDEPLTLDRARALLSAYEDRRRG